MLTFRYLYTFVNAAASLYTFYRLKCFTTAGAAISSILFFLYAPFGIMALSYNSLGIICLTLCLVTLLTARSCLKMQYAVCGVLYAFSVLCCPYLIILYFVYAASVLLRRYVRQAEKIALLNDNAATTKIFLYFSSGAAVIAALFVIFVFTKMTFGQFTKTLGPILDDPEHKSYTVFHHIKTYILAIFGSNKISGLYFIALIILVGAFIFYKGRKVPKSLYFLISCALTAIYLIFFLTGETYINFIIFPLCPLAAVCALLDSSLPVRRLFFYGWLPAAFYTFCLNMTSNQLFYAVSSASASALVISVIIIVLAAKNLVCEEKKEIKYAAAGVLCALFIIQTAGLACLRYSSVFWESSMSAQTQKLEVGTEKGIYVTPEKEQMYLEHLREIEEIENNPKVSKVLFISENTWLYLNCSKKSAAYSAWLEPEQEAMPERLLKYYELNPEKYPDAVFIERKYTPLTQWVCETFNLSPTQFPATGDVICRKNEVRQ